MNESRLDEALRELPRPKASPGFTSRVLARLEERPRRGLGLWPRVAAAAAAVMVIAGCVGLLAWRRHHEEITTERMAELGQIRGQLEELRREAAPPLVYLEGSNLDLLVDMRPAGRAGQAAERGRERLPFPVYRAAGDSVTY